MNEDILQNLKNIQDRIAEACKTYNRAPASVQLLLATKTVPSNRIKTALQAGCVLIAENKIQELKDKFEDLKDVPHTNHFIGHLQSNKIRELLKYQVSCFHSLDSLELAEKLNKRLEFENKTIEVLIQVNTSNEASKFGIHPHQALDFVTKAAAFKNLKIKGLMTIGIFSSESEKVRACFKLLKAIQQQLISANIENVTMDELSMGMSGDLEIAIQEGATIVRIGTAIFGKREFPDSYYWPENK